MSQLRRLDVRLFSSYALVVVVGAATLAITFVLLAPTVFDSHLRSMPGTRGGYLEPDSHRAFVDAVWIALPVAILVAVIASGVIAAIVARRILRPIDAVRYATQRLANGHYDERVSEPAELELAALAVDVNRLATELQATERRRRDLISEVAHEMRTPITTIDGYIEGLLDGVFDPSEEVLTGIGEETARLRRLATDLGSLSRADEDVLDLRPVPSDLTVLSVRVAARLRPQFEGKGVALEVREGPVLTVHVDEERIAQVLTNLLGNALSYTSAGGSVVVEAELSGRDARVMITDTGVGIAAGHLHRVFERFYRVPGIDRPAGGSGIGLTIARSIARAHGGDVDARSPGVGLGATFELQLPLSPDQT